MTIGFGYQDQYLDENAVEQVVQEALSNLELDGKRVLFLIPDGTVLTLTAANKGPLITANGTVTLLGGGTITLPDPQAVGNWEIARGTSVVDAGSGDLNGRWSVAR